jgi:hypothetical protein
VREGIPADDVHLHIGHTGPNDKLVVGADELISGGLVRNVLDLFQGVLEWGSSPHDASAFEETVRRGGAVVAIDAGDDAARRTAERVMETAGCSLHSGWTDLPEAG